MMKVMEQARTASHRLKGFTLVEVSIVLVIVGLIVGGVLVGRELIDNASMRKVISDLEKYQTAANTFRDKYGAFPGDYSHALSMFAVPAGASPLGSTCVTWNNSALCNGNGNGQVEPYYYDSAISSWYAEEFQFW
jgi:prepilin-type N-terminal cleavage/methylation domain-containing protein